MMNAPSPYSQQQGPAPQKKGSGCLIALGVVAALGFVLVVVVGVLVWRFAKSESGQKIAEFATKSQKLMEDAATNPIAKELTTLCPAGATVLDAAKVRELAKIFMADAGPADDDAAGTQIACAVKDEATAPTCEAVAGVFLNAAGRPEGGFTVLVKATVSRNPHCTAIYNQAGELIEKDGKAVGK